MKRKLVSYNKLFFCITVCPPILLILFLISLSGTLSFIVFYLVISTITLLGLHLILKGFFDEYIIFDEDKLVCLGSKFNNSRQKIIKPKKIVEILYEKETFAVFPGYRINIILIDEEENRHLILCNKIGAFYRFNNDLLDELSDLFNAPIRRQNYTLSSDLKKRNRSQG